MHYVVLNLLIGKNVTSLLRNQLTVLVCKYLSNGYHVSSVSALVMPDEYIEFISLKVNICWKFQE